MIETRIELLQGMPIFGGVGVDTLGFLLERVREVEVGKGNAFFQEGDPGTAMFVLQEGCVSILKRGDAAVHQLGRLGPGDCFGEMALLDLQPRSASVFAEDDSRAMQLEAGDLLPLARTNLSDFALIYMNLARELSRRLRRADDRLFRVKLDGHLPVHHYEFRAA